MSFGDLQAGEEIRVAILVHPHYVRQGMTPDPVRIELDVDYLGEQCGKLFCGYGSRRFLVDLKDVVGRVITYTEKRVVPISWQ